MIDTMTTQRFKSVMIIDDNEMDIHTQTAVLKKNRISKVFYSFRSAEAALEYLVKLPKSKLPELIFVDLNMPVMDGYGFIAEFEKLPKYITSKCKICLISAYLPPYHEGVQFLSKAHKLKTKIKYIEKPFKVEKLFV